MKTTAKFLSFSIAVMVGQPALSQSDEAAPSGSAASGSVLENIVVTATRRIGSLQEVPTAVTAITGTALESAGVETVANLTQATPGLVYSRTQINFQPVLRGIGSNNTGPGVESPVALYVDGVYEPDLNGNQLDLLKVERIEVLRGPQGTLFGRNATGGLINIITPDPSFEPTFEARARYGSFNERSLRAYASTGITDSVAVDIAALTYEDNGFAKDLVRGGKAGDRRSRAVRSKVYYEGDNLDVRVRANYFDTDDDSLVIGQPLDGNTLARAIDPNVLLPTKPNEYAGGAPASAGAKGGGVSVDAGFGVGNLRVELTSSYQSVESHMYRDSAVAPIDVLYAKADVESDTYTQELRLLSDDSENFQWITGLYAFKSDAAYSPLSIAGTTILEPDTKTKSWAAFGEGTWSLTDQISITAGLRYTSEDRDFRQVVNGNELFDTDASFDHWSPKILLQYFFSDRANAYVSYSEAFKSGAYNAGGTDPNYVDPEVNQAIEFGLKTDPLPWLRANFAAFWYDYDDLQISVQRQGEITPSQQNAGSARMRGLEAEIVAQLLSNLTVRSSMSYLDAKYRDLSSVVVQVPTTVGGVAIGGNFAQVIDASGNDVLRSPPYTFNLGIDYDQSLAVGGRLHYSLNWYMSGEVTYTYDERIKQGSYGLLSGEVAYETDSGNWRFSLWGDNLTDEEILETATSSTFGDIVAYRKPRRVGISIGYQF